MTIGAYRICEGCGVQFHDPPHLGRLHRYCTKRCLRREGHRRGVIGRRFAANRLVDTGPARSARLITAMRWDGG